MNHRFRLSVVLLLMAAAGAAFCRLDSGPFLRHGRGAARPGPADHFSILSLGTLKALLALKDLGWIPIPNLEIVGVHHQKEKTNYAESEKFVRENHLDWIKFHSIAADLGPRQSSKRTPPRPSWERSSAYRAALSFSAVRISSPPFTEKTRNC